MTVIVANTTLLQQLHTINYQIGRSEERPRSVSAEAGRQNTPVEIGRKRNGVLGRFSPFYPLPTYIELKRIHRTDTGGKEIPFG